MLGDDIPQTKRLVQVTASIFFCFTIAGLVFGFAALKPVLIESGVYADYCRDQPAPCKLQDTKLNILFTVASSITNVAALPMGAFLDRVGPKIASIMGGAIFALGCLVFSLQHTATWFDTYVWGYGLMALGAPAMFLAQFHLSNAFPARSGLILGAITGAFDASSLPLVFYKLVYFATGGKPSLKTFWLSYMAIPILLVTYQLILGPWDVYTRPPKIQITPSPQTPLEVPENAIAGDSSFSAVSWRRPNKIKSRTSSNFSRRSYAIDEDADDEAVKAGLEGKNEDPIVGVMFDAGVWDQIKSSWWICMFFTVIAQMTRLNWYMATVNAQLVYYTGNPELADTLTDAFIFLLPLGGIVSIPAIGFLLDTRPMKDIVVIMGIMATSFGILGMVRNTVAQLVGIAILTVFRPLYYTAISDYGAKVFGFHTFGTVYGLAMTLSGLFGLILTPLDILVKGPLNGSYTPVNIVLVLLGFVSALALYWRVRNPPRIELADTSEWRRTHGHTIMEEDED